MNNASMKHLLNLIKNGFFESAQELIEAALAKPDVTLTNEGNKPENFLDAIDRAYYEGKKAGIAEANAVSKGCSECGKKESDGWALYCVECADKFCDKNCTWRDHHDDCVRSEQEPVACVVDNELYFADEIDWEELKGTPLYTSPPRKEQDESYGYAKRLAESIWKDHYKEISPHWRPFPTTLGVLTQIDNMIAGIERQRKEWQGLDDEDWANIPDFQKEGCELDAAIADWIEKRLKGKNT